jgi:hypothetical protein
MIVKISELRALTEQLFAHLEQNRCNTVDISHDYYWDIPQENRYDPYQEPQEFTLGQLSDDWAELEKILAGNSEPIAYALVWLSTVLRAIGEKVVT